MVTQVTMTRTREYVPGERLKITYDDGEAIYFRDVRRGSSVWNVVSILDVTLSSEAIVHSLLHPEKHEDTDWPVDPENLADEAMPKLEQVLDMSSRVPTEQYFYLDGHFAPEVITIGEVLQGYLSTDAHDGGGMGVRFHGDHTVAAVEIEVIDGAP